MEEMELIREKEHLKFTVGKISDCLVQNRAATSELKTRIVEERSRIWEDFSRGSLNPSTEMQEVMQIPEVAAYKSEVRIIHNVPFRIFVLVESQ